MRLKPVIETTAGTRMTFSAAAILGGSGSGSGSEAGGDSGAEGSGAVLEPSPGSGVVGGH